MYLLALRLAELRGTLSRPSGDASWSRSSSACRTRIAELLDARLGGRSTASPSASTDATFFLYLGRHVGLPVCLEGALKLKEISYIATDAYAAGEMKHGPIALLDEGTPVVVVATDSPVLEKVISNMQEVRARGAHVIAVASEGTRRRARTPTTVLRGPATRLDAPAAARGHPAAAAGLPHRAAARAERRPAAQPGQDRHRRVMPRSRRSSASAASARRAAPRARAAGGSGRAAPPAPAGSAMKS